MGPYSIKIQSFLLFLQKKVFIKNIDILIKKNESFKCHILSTTNNN